MRQTRTEEPKIDTRSDQPQPSSCPADPRGDDRGRSVLLDLAQWVEKEFALALMPKIRRATEAEVIYAEIVRRLGEGQ